MKKILTLLAAATALCAIIPQAHAANSLDNAGPLAKERFMVRVRALDIIPDESTSLNIPGSLDVGNAITPEVDLSYFFTKNVSVEAIAATARHRIDYGASQVGDAWILPPTVTLQYHFMADKKFSPYVGAGLNYSFFYGEDAATGFTDLDVHNGVGYALQAGYDYWLNDHWGLNMDVKKLFLNIDASANNGAVQAKIDLDPWIVGAGVSYRF